MATGVPTTAAKIGYPQGIFPSTSAGDIYFSDSGARIREVNQRRASFPPTPATAQPATPATAGWPPRPRCIRPKAWHRIPPATLYTAEASNNDVAPCERRRHHQHRLRRHGRRRRTPTAAFVDAPEGVAVDSAGDVFIADYSNNRVQEINHATGLIATIAGTGPQRSQRRRQCGHRRRTGNSPRRGRGCGRQRVHR